MRAMILAAGRGKRMGALTDKIPKPLLRVGEKYLIEYSIASLVQAGIKDIVINISYHAEKIKTALGDGKRYGAHFMFSYEENALETGGGIVKALPLLGNEPFVVISSDIICDYPLQALPPHPKELAHLVVVDNPTFHPQGDFGLREGYLDMAAEPKFTFANIGVYQPAFFANCEVKQFPLSELLFPAIHKRQITGEYYKRLWFNVGTPKELEKTTTAGFFLDGR